MSEKDPDELHEETTIDEMKEWLEYVESCSADLTEWESEFIESVRDQFDDRVEKGVEKPLSGRQLVKLNQIYERL